MAPNSSSPDLELDDVAGRGGKNGRIIILNVSSERELASLGVCVSRGESVLGESTELVLGDRGPRLSWALRCASARASAVARLVVTN